MQKIRWRQTDGSPVTYLDWGATYQHPSYSVVLNQSDNCPYCIQPHPLKISNLQLTADTDDQVCTAFEIRPDFMELSLSLVPCNIIFYSKIMCYNGRRYSTRYDKYKMLNVKEYSHASSVDQTFIDKEQTRQTSAGYAVHKYRTLNNKILKKTQKTILQMSEKICHPEYTFYIDNKLPKICVFANQID